MRGFHKVLVNVFRACQLSLESNNRATKLDNVTR
jgi:hypothetical protein